jgi:hypothetical protein
MLACPFLLACKLTDCFQLDYVQEGPPTAVFAGPMPLTAIIACVTNRAVTNHPHYENTQLRKRTKQLYQLAAYRSDAQVHNAVAAYQADHIVLVRASCNRQER